MIHQSYDVIGFMIQKFCFTIAYESANKRENAINGLRSSKLKPLKFKIQTSDIDARSVYLKESFQMDLFQRALKQRAQKDCFFFWQKIIFADIV